MKLMEALKVAGAEMPGSAPPFHVLLACGFNPLHLETFLAARLRMALPHHRISVRTGLYGDLAGTLERLGEPGLDCGVVVIEWPDLDPRLGLRHLGGWGPGDLADILANVRARSRRIEHTIRSAAGGMPVAISLPTLPLPPASFTPGWQASVFELQIRECAIALAARLSELEGVRIVNPQRLDRLSPPGGRLNVKSELVSGFPYGLAHADALAEQLSLLLDPRSPKKGLITDLDDTLWSGIVGEAGAQGVSWDLDHHSQMNGVYQQLLRSLAEAGVLVAAASKNDPAVVAAALGRPDLILPQACIFPVEVQWGPKSQSVARILEAWNIGADAVVFVDDSRMELAEVQSAFPEIECLEFPRGREQAIYELLETLRDRFGKPRVSTEDAIRLRSIRDGRFVRERFQAPDASPSSFLEQAEGELTLDFNKHPLDPRALELVNKTNQFNLHGKRHTESAWRAYLQDAGTFLLVISYQDRYGPLGKIAVITGRSSGDTVLVENWVMSCRAFARQIEHHCLRHLFERYGAGEIAFNFEPTSRNGPLREFFAGILGEAPTGGFRLAKRDFLNAYPRTLHRIKDAASATLVPQAG